MAIEGILWRSQSHLQCSLLAGRPSKFNEMVGLLRSAQPFPDTLTMGAWLCGLPAWIQASPTGESPSRISLQLMPAGFTTASTCCFSARFDRCQWSANPGTSPQRSGFPPRPNCQKGQNSGLVIPAAPPCQLCPGSCIARTLSGWSYSEVWEVLILVLPADFQRALTLSSLPGSERSCRHFSQWPLLGQDLTETARSTE